MMMRRLAVATMATAICVGCGKDENNTDNSSNQNNSANNQTPNNENNTATNANSANSENANNGPAPWTAQLMGVDAALGLPTSVVGTGILLNITSMGVTINGTGSDGPVSLITGLSATDEELEVGTPYTSPMLTLGFVGLTAQCRSTDTMITFTSIEPVAAGTFAGSVECGMLPLENNTLYDGTISGTFSR